MSKIRDLFWPTLEGETAEQVPADEIEAIRQADLSQQAALALSEAQRIASDEEERRKTAEAKASNFLLVAAALVPLLTYLETAIWDAKLGTAPKWLTLIILSLAVAYLIGAVVWALRTVAVGTYHRVGSNDVLRIWRAGHNRDENLARETLIAVRSNQGEINRKVSAVKMTHLFMVRAVLVFCSLLLVQAFAEFGHEFDLWKKAYAAWTCVIHSSSRVSPSTQQPTSSTLDRRPGE
jgi:hypothetical protein